MGVGSSPVHGPEVVLVDTSGGGDPGGGAFGGLAGAVTASPSPTPSDVLEIDGPSLNAVVVLVVVSAASRQVLGREVGVEFLVQMGVGVAVLLAGVGGVVADSGSVTPAASAN